MNPTRDWRRALALAVLFTGFGALLNYMYRSFAARALGPEDYGQLTLVWGGASLAAAMGSLGLPVAVTRFMSQGQGFGSPHTQQFVTASLPVAAVGPTLLVLVFAFPFRPLVGLPWTGFGPLLVAMAAVAISTAVSELLVAAVRGIHETTVALTAREIGYRTILFAALLTLGLARDISPVAILWAITVAQSALSVGLGSFLWVKGMFGAAPFRERLQLLAVLLGFGVPILGSFASNQIIGQADNFFVAGYRGTAAVGLYNAAFPLSQLVWIAVDSVVFIAGPLLTSVRYGNSFSQLVPVAKTLTVLAATGAAALSLPLVLDPGGVLGAVFGPRYLVADQALVILTIGSCSYAVGGLAGALLIATGFTRRYLVSDLIALGSNLMLHVGLVPKYGIVGAAASVALSTTIAATIRAAFCFDSVRIWIGSWRLAFNVLVVMAAGSAALLISGVALSTFGWPRFAITAAAGGLAAILVSVTPLRQLIVHQSKTLSS